MAAHLKCKKRTSYAWSQYYGEIKKNVETVQAIMKVMEDADVAKHFPQEFITMATELKVKYTCPVCHTMVTPENVTSTVCGHFYCKGDLDNLRKKDDPECIICNRKI